MSSKRGQRRRAAKRRPPMLTGQKLNEALRLQKGDRELARETQRQLQLQALGKAFPALVDPYVANSEQVLAELDRIEDAERREGQEGEEGAEAQEGEGAR